MICISASDFATRQRVPARAPVAIAVASGSSGDGRTTVTAGLARCLAAGGRDVLALDANPRDHRLAQALGLFPRPAPAGTRPSGAAPPELLTRIGPRLRLRTSAANTGRLDPIREQAALIWSVNAMRPVPEVLLLDTEPSPANESSLLIGATQHVLLVVSESLSSVTGAARLVRQLYADHAFTRFKVFVNKTRSENAARQVVARIQADCEHMADVILELVGEAPFDSGLRAPVTRGRRAPLPGPLEAVTGLAAAIDAWAPPLALRGTVEFFTEQRLTLGSSRN